MYIQLTSLVVFTAGQQLLAYLYLICASSSVSVIGGGMGVALTNRIFHGDCGGENLFHR